MLSKNDCCILSIVSLINSYVSISDSEYFDDKAEAKLFHSSCDIEEQDFIIKDRLLSYEN